LEAVNLEGHGGVAMNKRTDDRDKKEIYRLWIDYLRKKDTFRNTVLEFNKLDVFKHLYGFLYNLKPLESKRDSINYNARLKEFDKVLQTTLSSLTQKIKNREVLLYYLLYFLFFYDIFAPSYSFENWWEWQTDKRRQSPPNIETFLISIAIQQRLNNGKPKPHNATFYRFFRPMLKRQRLAELKTYLRVYELRKEQKMKWKDIIQTIEPNWLGREIDSTRKVERTYYDYLEKAKKILNNLDCGIFPGRYLLREK